MARTSRVRGALNAAINTYGEGALIEFTERRPSWHIEASLTTPFKKLLR
jgi:hypothetical protein